MGGRAASGAAFEPVRTAASALPGLVPGTRYDGAPVLTLGGAFVAGLAMHASAEPDSLVVRVDPEDRALLLDEAPETYYLTEYYRRHAVVLVRLSRVDQATLRDLLTTSRRLTMSKARPGRRMAR